MKFGVVSAERIVGEGSGELGLVCFHKDLGVIVDHSLKFHTHICSIICEKSTLVLQLLRGPFVGQYP